METKIYQVEITDAIDQSKIGDIPERLWSWDVFESREEAVKYMNEYADEEGILDYKVIEYDESDIEDYRIVSLN